MARSENNLNAVFTDTANAIRAKTDTTSTICPRDFADKINSIEAGGGGMKAFFDAGGKCSKSTATTFNGIIKYDDTSNIRDARDLFSYCTQLKSIPQMDLRKVTDADNMFNQCTALFKIPDINAENLKKASNMFFDCWALESVPALNMSQVTDARNMFKGCTKLTSIPMMDIGNVKDAYGMFQDCKLISTIPTLDTKNVTNMGSMFNECSNLVTIPALNTSNVTSMNEMFQRCDKLTSVPMMDTSNVTNMSGIFSGCESLTAVPEFDVGKVRDFGYYGFYNCSNIEAIHFKNINADLDIHWCTKLTRDALLEVINNLKTVTNTKKLTMGSTNLAKLTDEDKAIATNKGWTLK